MYINLSGICSYYSTAWRKSKIQKNYGPQTKKSTPQTAKRAFDILITVALDRSDLSKYRNALATISSDLSLKHDVTVSLIVKPYNEFILYSNSLPFYKNVIEEGIRYATCC